MIRHLKTRMALAALAAGFATACLAQPAFEEDPIPARRPPPETSSATLAAPARADELVTLEDRLKATPAISPLKKLSLKSEIDDLLLKIRLAQPGGRARVQSLRGPYEHLIAKIHAMLGKDPKLANDIVASKDAIWDRLSDRTKYVALED